jgi:transcriptional regulator with XRE-family HTH domain
LKFKALQENLRKTLWSRIEAGGLTGLRLAQETGFQQAHISNFLNKKRGLSIEGMDRVLKVQSLSVLDLIDPQEVNRRASILPPSEDEFQSVFLVKSSVAATQPRIMSMRIREMQKFRKAFLRKLRPAMEGDRDGWERFVLLQLDHRVGMSMYPRLLPRATVLIDRHYNSLKPYHRGHPNLYAVAKAGACVVKYVELAGRHLVLRGHNHAYPVEVMPLEDGKTAGDYLVGRICHVGSET